MLYLNYYNSCVISLSVSSPPAHGNVTILVYPPVFICSSLAAKPPHQASRGMLDARRGLMGTIPEPKVLLVVALVTMLIGLEMSARAELAGRRVYPLASS